MTPIKTIINSKTQIYYTIYHRMYKTKDIDKLKYFLNWNKGLIKGRRINEQWMFDSSDLYYIKTNNGKSIY